MRNIDEYGEFCRTVHSVTGVDLSGYKERQMRRRLESLFSRKGYASFMAYAEAIRNDAVARAEFLDKMTINVSEFFRNPGRWSVLEQRVVPELLASSHGGPVTAWSAACSTGEEPYTLAMIMEDGFRGTNYSITATDIDEQAISRAIKAQYPVTALQQIPERYRARFLMNVPQGVEINPDLRRHIEFKRHDLLRDPYPRNIDLIICRNVMIYFTDDVKERLYRNFSEALRPGGILFVGSTEQMFRAKEYGFKVFDSFLYQRV